ncbi:MAG: hypothetical protein GDA37_12850 [Ekhidna sp.]|nr:hypothetical protein [Ekhidna sp.]
MRIFSLVGLLVLGTAAWIFIPSDKSIKRINGVSLVNPPRPIESLAMQQLHRVNAEWVAIIPYGFSRSGQGSVSYDHSRQWWGERTEGSCMLIQYAKENNLKVMVKPHVWIAGEGWCGDFDLATEAQWQQWVTDFQRYILNHAKKADSLDVELFCIGTEYRIPARERPEFWRSLIRDVREVYDGRLTYASNWDNYENITWWDELDYIGVDAYFPLTKGDHPTIDQIKEGWDPVKRKLKAFSQKWDKPVLFTEFGFQSVNGAAGKHWKVEKSSENINLQLQADAYEATFRALENESWWAGGFFWKWHFTMQNSNRYRMEWTPQDKPAEQVIARWYAGRD